ncbi:MAG: GNAT family N-acetyltransferase [Betaproteobacteria bacterium]|nr:GNAT family N-acetyltransferase [Betaproteobacteria bacterium]
MIEQRVGEPVDARPAERPQRTPLPGRYVDVVPVDAAAHGDDLFAAATGPGTETMWTYLSVGPWPDRASLDAWLRAAEGSQDPFTYALVEKTSNQALGIATYMRIEPKHRVIEVGGIWYTPALQRTRAATEAMYLMAKHAFEVLRYRRYEWKCNAFNEPSRRAALRLGFTYEGLFRQHMIARGRNRDTAWFSLLEAEWPARRAAFERWLEPENFDAAGRQRTALAAGGMPPAA